MSLDRPEHEDTLESLGRQLRRLPAPTVPSHLEARLLAAIPSRPVRTRPPTRIWLAAAVLWTAAASLLIVLHLPHRRDDTQKVVEIQPAPPDPAPTLWRYEQALRRSDADESVVFDSTAPPFEWPVAGSTRVFLSDRLGESLP